MPGSSATTEGFFLKNGFALIPGVLGQDEIAHLCASLAELKVAAGHRRVMERVPEIRALAHSGKLRTLIQTALEEMGADPQPVRSIFFDKTPEANWLVPWHQDLTIAVRERVEVPGFGPWSIKEGVVHVQPPAEFLGRMVTIRLHLDDCPEANGPLQVIPGSHAHGKLGAEAIASWRKEEPVACTLKAGDVLLMRPLILHASAPALEPCHRRVIHLEYSLSPLPDGLGWAES